MQKIVNIEIRSHDTAIETSIKSDGITKEELANILLTNASSLYKKSENYTTKYEILKDLKS